MASSNSNTNENIESTSSKNKVDELLLSGKIANAVDFYNYFKNKQTTNITNTPSSAINSKLTSSMSHADSLYSAASTYSKASTKSNNSNFTASHGNVMKRNSMSSYNMKKVPKVIQPTMANTLNEYANIFQPTTSSQLITRNSPSPLSPLMHNNSKQIKSSSSPYNNLNNKYNKQQQQQQQQQYHHHPSHHQNQSPYNFRTIYTPVATMTTTTTTSTTTSHHSPFSLYNLDDPTNVNMNLGIQIDTKTNVFNAYLIDAPVSPSRPPMPLSQIESTEATYLMDSNINKSNSSSNIASSSSSLSTPTNNNNNSNNSRAQLEFCLNSGGESQASLSSMFLNSTMTSYYQKYKMEKQKQEQKLKYQSSNLIKQHNKSNNSSGSFNPSGQILSNDFERKKEDAINRIIRNERIKEIRIKMHEYELLKEYQSFNSTNSNQQNQSNNDVLGSQENMGTSNDAIDDFTNSNIIFPYYSNPFTQSNSNTQHSNQNLNKHNRTFRVIKPATNYHQQGDESPSSKLSAYNLDVDAKGKNANRKVASFDEYKDSNDCDGEGDDDDEDVCGGNESNEDSNESGIEDDANYFTPKHSNQKSCRNIDESLLSTILNSKNSSLFVKPGFEMYQIGGGIFNLNSSQSTFQLKCSIISAEVKNIVNILKQVLDLKNNNKNPLRNACLR